MTEALEFTIRQSEFADKHGLLPGEMKDLRNQWLKEGHGFKSIGRPIFLTPNAVKVLEAALATPETDETQTDPVEKIERFDCGDPVPSSYEGPEWSPEIEIRPAPKTFFEPQGEDAAHEVAAALAAARAKHSAHLTTAAQQADTLPEPEDEQPLEAAETPENFSALVLKVCKNKRFVYASFQGQKIAVQVHPRNQQKVIRKNIRVRAEKEGDTTRYIHVP